MWVEYGYLKNYRLVRVSWAKKKDKKINTRVTGTLHASMVLIV